MESVVPRDRSISDLLSRAASADLEVLADLITDSGKGSGYRLTAQIISERFVLPAAPVMGNRIFGPKARLVTSPAFP